MSKVYGIATRTDAETFLLEALEETDRNSADYNLDNIVSECYDAVGCWDIQQVDEDLFWEIIRNNAR